MPYHDLNVAYSTSHTDLAHTLSFLHELNYSVAAVNSDVAGALPPKLFAIPISAITPLVPPNLRLLTRLTLTISDNTQNHRLSSLQSQYDIVAVRPTNEKSFQLCCNSLECDLISLDFSQRFWFVFKFSTVSAALQRGVRFEICYAPGIVGGSDARRNLITGATSLIRATRGKGIVISSAAESALGLRAAADVINLVQIWGLSQERGKEAVCEEAAKVVNLARLKRTSFRGVVDVLNGSAEEKGKAPGAANTNGNARATTPMGPLPTASGVKRTASIASLRQIPTSQAEDNPPSKSQKKQKAKKARLEGENYSYSTSIPVAGHNTPRPTKSPLKHEALDRPSLADSHSVEAKKK